ncbi:RNA polymerase sigma factor [Algoriphagus sp. AK58]|uniref:RNA polymerase sigma factor n=1 Tax=Algoriphagus sp. AK58 TaxID=1406877 RepID=UPI00165092DB|nr:RNA polymerase sigma factor [Algoriphagus sp. AK58]MBC6366429.1 RNA polymerase subunit sigma [Algoriphagus sp. AK58]
MKSFFEAHIWPLRGRLYRMVYLWTKDRDLSEDLLQNVFAKTVERQTELQVHPNLGGWLVKSLKNETLMHFRKTNRMTGLEGTDDIPQYESHSLESREQHQLIFALVDQLPQKQKEIFLLREVEELSYEEISQQLEISLDQVKINLHRARKSVREKLINQGITR